MLVHLQAAFQQFVELEKEAFEEVILFLDMKET